MKTITIENDVLKMVVAAMGRAEMFTSLSEKSLSQIAGRAVLNQYEPQETIVKEKEPSDAFYMLINGQVSVLHYHRSSDGLIELGQLKPYTVIGEIGLLLNEPRTATIQATEKTLMLKFDSALFNYMFENIPAFGPIISKNLATRVQKLSSNIPLPMYDKEADRPDPEVLKMIPIEFSIRHRVLPLQTDGNVIRIGFVNSPNSKVISAVQRFLPSMELQMVQIDNDFFDEVLGSKSGVEEWASSGDESAEVEPEVRGSAMPKLDSLLKRAVAEGASDVHLSAGHVPHWRIDGEIKAIEDAKIIEPDEVFELIKPAMDENRQKEFLNTNDIDFVYPLHGTGRFRVNLFRDDRGISGVFRFIPSKILTFEQLGLPPILKKLCSHPKGLVLITGPTGSGKSTTLAAMINYINTNRSAHIVTMEDPIEFSHTSQKSLINQREIGSHTHSFSTALRAALREDPDIVLVGEMRDVETTNLAIETANTGHLVFATMHTNTAISTMDRIIDSFPPEQQSRIRVGLCESLKGVVAQVLCKCIGGGRTAAIEVLVVNTPIANLVREEKMNQILSSMQTGKAHGHMIFDEELAKLVIRKKITREEALSKVDDKEKLTKSIEEMIRKRQEKITADLDK